NKSSRIHAAREIMVQLARHELPQLAQTAENPVHIILTTMRDLVQLIAIAHHVKITDDPTYIEKARLLLKDAVDLSDCNELPTPGRDTQFELFANACWSAAGTIARLGSPPAPDLLITTALDQFGAEAKRIKSVKSLKKRAKQANKQLRFCPSGG